VKYVLILGDGMADDPIVELGGKTPLQTAYKPFLDGMAVQAELGLVKTIPEGYPPGSDVANMSVLGYEPQLYYTGRSPLEAVSLGLEMGPDDVALRCNLVTLAGDGSYAEKTMADYSAGEISTAEAAELIRDVQRIQGSETFHFYPGISYRHCLIWQKGQLELDLTPPHDISDRVVGSYLPKGAEAGKILGLMEWSMPVLENHPVNLARVAQGLNPANSIWLWGQGKKPALAPFAEKYGLRGAMVCAVDLMRGLGICAGLQTPTVPGATGNMHTNFRGKAEAALAALADGCDFVYVHVEAPDEAGHQGNLTDKVKSIEIIDREVVAVILDGLRAQGEDFRLMVLPDHPTPLHLKTHTSGLVPFMIYDSRHPRTGGTGGYDEENARLTGLRVLSGPDLMHRFIKGGS